MVRGRPPLTFTTQQHQDASLFEIARETPAVGSEDFLSGTKLIPELLAGWDARRALGISPLKHSGMAENERDRIEFLEGCHMLGLLAPGRSLKPQQLLVADTLAKYDPYVAMLMPRRSTKTTNLFAIALGRCKNRPGYLVGYAQLTTALKARDRFRKDIAGPIERTFKGIPESARGFKILRSGGAERVEFDNGSVFQVFPPEGAAFRSDAFDMIILDESGEASPEMGDDVLAGALSTFDTRDDAQLVIAGTAAKYRKGNLLWDYLEDGRAGANRTGIVEYAAPDSVSDEDLEDWDIVRGLVLACHPGIRTEQVPDNLTTLETIRERWVKQRARFLHEYLSIFGTAGATPGLMDFTKWTAGGLKGKLPAPPSRFALAIAVHPNQTSACVVAAWRVKNKARLLVIDYRHSVDWLADYATAGALKFRTGIVHDTNGPITAEVERIARKRPKPKLLPQTFPNIKTAAALIVKEIELGRVEHYDQEPLNEAVKLAVKRSVGPTAWALGRPRGEDDADIICIEAGAMALRVYDQGPRPTLLPPEED